MGVKGIIRKNFQANINKNGKLMHHMNTRCWDWTAAKDDNGYGEFGTGIGGQIKYAHHQSWENAGGPKPSRWFQLHHICNNAGCVNPSHMAMVMAGGHRLLEIANYPMKCVHEHSFNNDNPLIDGNGYRRCRECAHESKRRSKGR